MEPVEHSLLDVCNMEPVEHSLPDVCNMEPVEHSLLDVCNMNCKSGSKAEAVIFDDGQKRQSITYKQVSDLSDELSRMLKNYIEDNSIVGICLDTQLITPVLLIGILKSGAAFYSFDSDALQYVQYVLTLLGCSIVLTDDHNIQVLQDLVEEFKGEVIPMTSSEQDLTLTLVYLRGVSQKYHPTKLAYCITTSGTTGKPKIVKVPHSCIVPNIVDLREIYSLTSDDLVLLCSPLTFDPSIVEIFTTFSAGATVLIVPSIVKMLPELLLNIISHRNKVTVMQATPTLLSRFMPKRLQHSLLGSKTSLRLLSLGGEEFPDTDIINSYRAENNKTMLINIYGITEVSTWATYYKVTEEDVRLNRKIPLGRYLKDTMVEVRDEQGVCITEGIGELYVGGLTRQCIIMSSNDTDKDNYDESVVKWCPTGDIVKLDSEGNLFYVRRRNDQMKRNGKRINLEEIRQVVLGYDGIQNCITLMSESNLVTFVTLSQTSSAAVCVDDVRKHVTHHLPAHCVPDDVIVIEYLPMTKHGKIDREHLKEMYGHLKSEETSTMYSTAFLKMKWKITLCVEIFVIKSDSNFIQLGGNSVTAIHLLNDLEILFKVQLPHLLDKLINETFEDCDQYLYGKINRGDVYTSRIENYTNSIPINEMNDNKRKCDKLVSDIGENPKPKVPHVPSSFTHTISKGNRYMKCKSVLTGADGYVETKWEEGRNCMKARNIKSSEMVKTIKQECNDSDSCSSEKNQVRLFELERTTEIGNSNLCLIEESAMVKSLGIGKDQLNNIPEEYRVTNGDKTEECDNECPTLKDKQEIHQSLSGNDLAYITEDKDELSTTDIILQLEESWKFDTGKCVDASPLLALSREERNVIFIGSHSHKIFAIAMATGDCLWEKTLRDRIEATACLSLCGNFVIIGCYDGCIYSLDCDTGSTWWKYQTGSQVKCCPTVDGHTGLVYVGSHNQSVYCLDIQSRMVVWENQLRCGSIFSSPALDHVHNTVYVATLGGKVFSLEKDNGHKNWIFDCKKPVFSSLTPTENGVLIGCTDRHVYHIDFKGTLIWKFSTGAPIFSSPSIFPRDWIKPLANEHQQFVLGSHDGVLYCLSTPDGTLLWKTDFQSAVYSSPFCAMIKVNEEKDCETPVLETGKHPILPDSSTKRTAERNFKKTMTFDGTSMKQDCVSIPVIVVCSTVGVLYVMDARNGRIFCERTFPGELFSSPILYKNSIFLGCRDNYVYRINLYVTRKF